MRPITSTNLGRGDGLVFTTTFSAYEVRIDPGQDASARDCRFAVKVHVPSGQSVALQTFSYSGFALLTDGVRGTLQATYAYRGAPVAPRSGPRAPLVGPHEGEFVLRDDVPVSDTVWSPCGRDTELDVATTITLENPGRQGSGYMNMSAFDGSSNMEARLQARPCN